MPNHAPMLHLRLVLGPQARQRGARVDWIAACILAWQAQPGLVLSLDEADDAAAPVLPEPTATPALLLALEASGAARLMGSATSAAGITSPTQPTSAAPLAASLPAWVLCDGEQRLLQAHQPLLHSITQGQGIALELKEQPSAGQGSWHSRRSLRLGACTNPAVGLLRLADAVQQLVAQSLAMLRLGAPPQAPSTPPLPAPPGSSGWRHRAAQLAGRARAWLALQSSRWMSEYWRIGLVDAPVMDWVASGGRLPVRWITSDHHRGYWADPMGMVGDDRQLFAEFFDERSGQGHLECLRVDGEGTIVQHTRMAVGGGQHTSFPLVLSLDGRRLGVAESAATGACVLHEVDAQGRWHPLHPLLEQVSAVDPALFQWQGRYWLAFTNLALGSDDNLCLYHADRLQGPWQPHANNPVKRDVAASRMAGGFFEVDGQLYRPAQDCLGGYGKAVVLHRVLRCTPTDYAEERVSRITPDPQGPCPDGLHTLSAWGQRTLIDGKRMGFNPLVLRRKLAARWGIRRASVPATVPSATQHVAVYVPHLRVGGGETSLLRLAGSLAASGLQVDLVVNTLSTAALVVPPGVQVQVLGADGTAASLRQLVSWLRTRRPQVLVSGFPHTNVAAVTAVGLARVDCQTVVTEHAPLSLQIRAQGHWRYKVLPPLVRWAYERAGAVVAVSHGVRDDLASLLGHSRRLRVIANPVLGPRELAEALADEPPPRAAGGATADEDVHPWLHDARLAVVLSVSRLSPEKDLPTLVEAFARLHAQQPRTRLVVCGDGPEQAALQALLQARGLAAVSVLVGRVTRPLRWMRKAAVFALASRYEGFGNVLVEALAAGVPVVATDCPVGPREILASGRYGRLVPVGDAPAMAQALADTLAQGGQPLGAQAHALGYTEQAACAAYRDLFDRLRQVPPDADHPTAPSSTHPTAPGRPGDTAC